MAQLFLRLKALALIALLALCASAHATEEDKGVLANLISRALSSPGMSVSIGAVNGVLSSDASISDIVISDRQGPWLKVDKARLVWNRLALFSRRLEVDQLTIGRLEFLRRPLPSETPPPDTGAQQPILPELPVKVLIKQFGVQELSLGEPVVGVAARLSISGKATLGPPSEGLDLTLTAQRLDAPGDFKTLLTYIPATDKLTLNVNSSEPAGGIFAHLANLPGLPPVKLAFNGAGALDNFTAKLDFNAGADVWANGQVIVARQGAARKLTLDLNSRLEGLAPGVVQPVFAGHTTLKGDVQFNDDSSIALPGGLHLVSAAARLDFEGERSAEWPARFQGPRRRHSRLDNGRKTGPQRLDHWTACEPNDRRRFRRRGDPCRARIGRPSRGDLPREPRWSADGREDANPVREPGLGEGSCASRSRLRPSGRTRAHAQDARLGFVKRRSDVRRSRPLGAQFRRAIFRSSLGQQNSRQGEHRRPRLEPFRAARGRRA